MNNACSLACSLTRMVYSSEQATRIRAVRKRKQSLFVQEVLEIHTTNPFSHSTVAAQPSDPRSYKHEGIIHLYCSKVSAYHSRFMRQTGLRSQAREKKSRSTRCVGEGPPEGRHLAEALRGTPVPCSSLVFLLDKVVGAAFSVFHMTAIPLVFQRFTDKHYVLEWFEPLISLCL